MTNNVGRIFEFKDLRTGESVFLNAPDRFTYRDVDRVLETYINWFNNEFIVVESNRAPIKKEYFNFLRHFMFIDFYDDLNNRW